MSLSRFLISRIKKQRQTCRPVCKDKLIKKKKLRSTEITLSKHQIESLPRIKICSLNIYIYIYIYIYSNMVLFWGWYLCITSWARIAWRCPPLSRPTTGLNSVFFFLERFVIHFVHCWRREDINSYFSQGF